MFIRTQRLFLRPTFPEDWREVLAGIGEEAIVRNLARAPWPYREEDARQFCASAFAPAAPSLLVTVPGPAGAPVIGGCGYGPRDDSDELELGYWIARSHWGRGFATEAARAVCGLARAVGIGRLGAGHFADNPASGRVLRKVGFRPIDAMRERYSRGRDGNSPCVEYQLDLAPVAPVHPGAALAEA